MMIMAEVKIQIIYDNTINSQFEGTSLKSDWGFSAIVTTKNHKILFDTGAKFSILYENMLRLNYKPEEIDTVFISHEHKDHIGGLMGFLKKNPQVTVYIPNSISESKKKEIIKAGGQIIETSKITTLFDNIATTGPMGTDIKEQSMIIMTTKGAVIITGCSHPGIVNITESVKVLSNVYAVIGGFHLFREKEEKIKEIVDEMKNGGIEKIMPAHCTGEKAKEKFKEEFGNKYLEAGVGSEVLI